MSWRVSGVLVALALAAPAHADIVVLRTGRSLEGECSETPEGLRVGHPGGAVLVPRHEVVEVDRRELPWETLERGLAVLEPGRTGAALRLVRLAAEHDLQARVPAVLRRAFPPDRALPSPSRAMVELGLLCLDLGHRDEARRLLAHAASDPALSPVAGAGLGRLDFHLEAGRWVAPEDYYPARGYVRFEGSWVRPGQAALIQAERDLVAARAAVARAIAAERDALAAAGADGAPAEALARARAARAASEQLLSRAEEDLLRAQRAALLGGGSP